MSSLVAENVNGARLWADLMAMAEVGRTPTGGCRRLALTDEDRAGRALFADWAQEIGLSLRADQAGNLYARLPGRDPDRLPMLLGSHLDTQPDGGRFDGVLGVLGALESVRAIQRSGIEPSAPIEIVVWANEEGARFPRFCTGSAAFSGALSLAELRGLVASDGPTYGAELDRTGLAGDEAPGATQPAAYLELHIEQGPLLEREGRTIGLVKGIRGIRQIEIDLVGTEAHAGGPMESRRDACLAAARAIGAVEEVVRRQPGAAATIGQLELSPGVPSVVPGEARLVVDVRPNGLTDPRSLVDEVHRAIEAAAKPCLVGSTVERLSYGPAEFDPRLLGLVRSAAERLGERPLEMVSPAGHDAGYIARVAPTAMIFVPCRKGLSHHPDEAVEPEHAAAGVRVLAEALARLVA